MEAARRQRAHGLPLVQRPPDGTPRRRPFDGWAHHPAAFSFAGLTEALRRVDPGPGALIADPFAGSGRAATRAVARGQRFWGLEAHPLLASLAAAKVARPGDDRELLEHGERIFALSPEAADPAPESAAVQRFVDPRALPALQAMRTAALAHQGPWRDHLTWVLLAGVRVATANGWPYRRPASAAKAAPDVRRAAREVLLRMGEDLRTAPLVPDALIECGDARRADAWTRPAGTVEAVVTSPPYLNQVSYLEATRLDLLFLQPDLSATQLRARFGAGLLSSCTQQVNGAIGEQAWTELHERVPTIAQDAWRLAQQLAVERSARRYGKAYDHLLGCYLRDILDVLTHQLRALAPGAGAAWVMGDSALYGVHVDTPRLVARLAIACGHDVTSDVRLRDRGQRWSPGGRPKRDLCERIIELRRPDSGVQLMLPGL